MTHPTISLLLLVRLILPGNYEVVISSKLLSRFKNTSYDLVYYIALEPDSTFG
jgi:hypothetical protein